MEWLLGGAKNLAKSLFTRWKRRELGRPEIQLKFAVLYERTHEDPTWRAAGATLTVVNESGRPVHISRAFGLNDAGRAVLLDPALGLPTDVGEYRTIAGSLTADQLAHLRGSDDPHVRARKIKASCTSLNQGEAVWESDWSDLVLVDRAPTLEQ